MLWTGHQDCNNFEAKNISLEKLTSLPIFVPVYFGRLIFVTTGIDFGIYVGGLISWIRLDNTGSEINLNDLADVVVPTPNENDVLKFSGGNWISATETGGSNNEEHILFQETIPVIALNTLANLTKTPVANSSLLLFVGGQQQEETVDFLISGKTLTWVSPTYNITPADTVIVIYKLSLEIKENIPVLALNSLANLPYEPEDINSVCLFINGQLRENTIEFIINPITLAITWIPVYISITITDIVSVYYKAKSLVQTIMETLTVTGLNTITNLMNIPKSSVALFLNGQLRENIVEFTNTGIIINWLANPPIIPNINISDTIKVIYQI